MTTELTDLEQAVLRMYADGDTVVAIAREYDIPASSVRGLLYRTCDFDLARAAAVLGGGDAAPTSPPPPPPPAAPPPPPAAAKPAPAPRAPAKPAPPPAPPPASPPLPAAITTPIEVTYRVLDYWTSRGYIHADEDRPGSGRKRTWPDEEQAVAQLMARLCQAGLTPMGAHHAARNDLQLLNPGVRLVLDDKRAPAAAPAAPAAKALSYAEELAAEIDKDRRVEADLALLRPEIHRLRDEVARLAAELDEARESTRIAQSILAQRDATIAQQQPVIAALLDLTQAVAHHLQERAP